MFSFFNFRRQTEAIQPAKGSIPCQFCDISAKNGFKIVWEVYPSVLRHLLLHSLILQDDTFVAFEDIRPAAMHHLQITPKKHIGEVRNDN
jgi:diadenosine tetraphosphate (Ap4A) HIT family hydrolase